MEFNGRPEALCESCHSLERTRAMAYLLKENGLLRNGIRIAHFAPERAIGLKLMEIVGPANYHSFDIAPERYDKALNTQAFDLTKAERLPTDYYDLIIHSHVMEHIPCYITPVLWHLQRALTPSGRHLCVIPMLGARSESDFSDLSDYERAHRFGQKDHFRRFGTEDVNMTLGKIFNLNPRNYRLKVPDEVAAKHNFSKREVYKTFFFFEKSDLLLR
ncbi:MAG: hypothetical protein JKP98_23075 [Rhodobacteraceae bacterium]|nr:hypothetical protein [Paracoccaceae bacterium]